MSAPLEDAPLKKGKKFPFLGKDLVLKRTSARTATDVGSSGLREEPDKTQWSDEGLSAADRKVDQWVQQH